MTTPPQAMIKQAPETRRRAGRPLFWFVMMPVCGATGLLYSFIFAPPHILPPIVYAAVIGSLVIAFERGVFLASVNEKIRRLPTLLYIPLAEVTYIGIIACGNVLAGLALWSTGLVGDTLLTAVVLTPQVLLYALCCSAVLVFLVRVRDLIGADAFLSLLTGRYHRPVEEERIFAFIDMIGSTAYAERHGDVRAQRYLGAFFEALAEPVRRHGGAIDDYIGDMALVTWPMARGLRGAGCIACVFAFEERIRSEAALWRSRFGQVPEFRAAVHGGPVVTAEIGVDRHKISYFGDCVNTTARIETLCRSLQVPILLSSSLLDRLPGLPPGLQAWPLGDHAVKGRDRPIGIFGVGRRDGRDTLVTPKQCAEDYVHSHGAPQSTSDVSDVLRTEIRASSGN